MDNLKNPHRPPHGGKQKRREEINEWLAHKTRPAPWKADVYGFTLSLLPAALVFHMGLAAAGVGGAQWVFSLCLYGVAILIVLFIKGLSKELVDNRTELCKFLVGFSFVLAFAIIPILVEIFGNTPAYGAWVGLIGAAIVALVSHKMLALSPDYLAEAEKAPPLSRESWIRRYALCNFVLASLLEFSIILYHL